MALSKYAKSVRDSFYPDGPPKGSRSRRSGPRKRTNSYGVGSEHHEQVMFVARFRAAFPKFARLLYAVPNGGRRSRMEAASLKAEGVQPGVPDLVLAVARGEYHGLYIEMKRPDGKGRVSKDQKVQIALLREQGYCVEVCLNAKSAWSAMLRYLKLHGKSTPDTTKTEKVQR